MYIHKTWPRNSVKAAAISVRFVYFMCVCVYAYMCVYLYMYIYVYTCMHTSTSASVLSFPDTHTHIYIYRLCSTLFIQNKYSISESWLCVFLHACTLLLSLLKMNNVPYVNHYYAYFYLLVLYKPCVFI